MSPVDISQYNKIFQEKMAKLEEHDRKKVIAEQLNRDELDGLVALVNSILAKHKVPRCITRDHIRFDAGYIGNILDIEDKLLSHLIYDHYFPRADRASYYHYTSWSAFKSIVQSKKIRLSNLNKRFTQGEFTTFYREHGMDGYRAKEAVMGIDTHDEAIMADIFFISLSGTGHSMRDDSLWNDFGDGGAGVRLEFTIDPQTTDFRRVFYATPREAQPLTLLKDLFAEVLAKYDMPFNFRYSSKIGAYYIRGRYQNEDEYRLVVKRTSDDYGAFHLEPVVTDSANNIAYIELDFQNAYAHFELKTVQPGFGCSDEDIAEIKEELRLSNVNATVLSRAVSAIM
jgi:hypothetical protein